MCTTEVLSTLALHEAQMVRIRNTISQIDFIL